MLVVVMDAEVWAALPVLKIRQLYTATLPIAVSFRAALDPLLLAINNFPHSPLRRVVCMICV